jgi:hypothetical protein
MKSWNTCCMVIRAPLRSSEHPPPCQYANGRSSEATASCFAAPLAYWLSAVLHHVLSEPYSTSRSWLTCLNSPSAASVKPSAASEGGTLRPRPRLQPHRPQGHPLVDWRDTTGEQVCHPMPVRTLPTPRTVRLGRVRQQCRTAANLSRPLPPSRPDCDGRRSVPRTAGKGSLPAVRLSGEPRALLNSQPFLFDRSAPSPRAIGLAVGHYP